MEQRGTVTALDEAAIGKALGVARDEGTSDKIDEEVHLIMKMPYQVIVAGHLILKNTHHI